MSAEFNPNEIKSSTKNSPSLEDIKNKKFERMLNANKRSRAARRSFLITSFGLIFGTSFFIALLIIFPIERPTTEFLHSSAFKSAAIVTSLITGAVFLLNYLREAGPAARSSPALADRVDDLERKLANQNEMFSKEAGKFLISPDERQAIVSNITEEIRQSITKKLFESLAADNALLRERHDFIKRIDDEHEDAVLRLERAIFSLQNRANVNLVFGIILSVLGVGILWQTLTMSLPGETGWEFARAYLPRLSLILVIEIFSYFFLNLYKSNLTDTRYFHNELTNISNKRVALLSSLEENDRKYLGSVIEDLSKTERNSILTKGQATYELAKAKIESDSAKNFAGLIEKLLQTVISQKKD
ncbi:hypothetical protein [Burkholderia gladioli]|uniref:hypothetical protein n=1 Tax=Burkholderia gladioli TaxID=28095 RepID=UPI000FDC666F|nr:hypothetical protein [Burkholderia gladioli]MBU9422608.1 hypothetical protein [Burkholderia gladioli]MDN8060015.1 hypothetical protein [Burkholderia gladioli]